MFRSALLPQDADQRCDVVVVTPNDQLRASFQEKLSPERWKVYQASSGASALELLRRNALYHAVLLLDPLLPDLEPEGFRVMIASRFPETQILMINSQTGQLLGGNSSPSPVSEKLISLINSSGIVRVHGFMPGDNERLRGPFERRGVTPGRMIGRSEPMRRTWALTRMVATRNTTVLITGESGTGKEVLAQEIQLLSDRRHKPFVVVNCSAIPDALLESELFGYTKGAFTGAVQSRIGRIQAAHGGVLFLDEIGDMPLALQGKILRFLEQGEVQKLGGNDNIRVDVRVIAATNADLKKRVAEGRFREDLYYRLAVFPIHLAPLRERMDDLPLLAQGLMMKHHPGISLLPEAVEILIHHTWPGNIRELRNVIERAVVLAGRGAEVKAEHILL
jgi:DNA-binding NtrC family response regulator